MESEEFNYNQIERYLADQMTAEEKVAFEALISDNATLRDEVALHKDISAAATEEEVMNFRAVARSVIKAQSSRTITIALPSSRRYFMIAASVALLIVAGISINLLLFKARSTEELFSNYFEPYQDLISGRNDTNTDKEVALFMSLYNQENYLEAIDQLNTIDLTNKPLLQLYAGICFLGTDQLDDAEKSFAAPALGRSLYAKDARWYAALTLLKEGNAEEAKKALTTISQDNSDGSYQKRAQALIDEME